MILVVKNGWFTNWAQVNLRLGSYCNIPFINDTTSLDKLVGTLYNPFSILSTNSSISSESKADLPINIS